MQLAGADPTAGRKRYRLGTHRTVSPLTTVRRLEPLASAMGVTRVAMVSGLDVVGIEVAMAVRPASRNLSVLQGKGADIAAARASALMEAAESHAAEYRPVSARRCSIARMPPEACIPENLVTGRLDRHSPMRWRRGRNLLTRKRTWAPEEAVLADLARPAPAGHGNFLATTNGLAAGNSIDEAALHAVCEIIERDAHALWQFSSSRWRARTGVALASVDDPTALGYLERLRRADIDVRVWSIASDIAVPAFLCRISDARAGREPRLGRFFGAGCHPDRAVALCRALTEAAQSRLTAIVGARDDIDPMIYRLMGWHAPIADALARAGEAHQARIDFTTIPSFASTRVGADLAATLARLEAAGVKDVVAVDLTRPELGVPVVRVLAPELEGLQWRYGRALGARAVERLVRLDRG